MDNQNIDNNIDESVVEKLPLLLCESLGNTAIECGEVILDSIINDSELKQVPIVSAIVGFCKLGINLRERNLLMQTIAFLREFNEGSIEQDKLIEYRVEIKENKKKAKSELERVLLILDSNIDVIYSRILGRLFFSYINRIITWDFFVEYSEATRRLFVSDIEVLVKLSEQNDKFITISTDSCYRYNRLEGIGFVSTNQGVIDKEKGYLDGRRSYINITVFGMEYIKYSSLKEIIKTSTC